MSNQTKTSADEGKAKRDDGSMGPGEAAQDVASEARSKASDVKDKVVGETKRAKDELTDQAQGFFDELKEALSDQVGRLSSALRGAEREFEEHQLGDLAMMPRQLADGIEDVSDYFRERSGRGLQRDFGNAVANRPMAVVGGLVAVGAVIAWSMRKDQSYPDALAGKGSDDGPSGSKRDRGGSSGDAKKSSRDDKKSSGDEKKSSGDEKKNSSSDEKNSRGEGRGHRGSE